jgi:uncharacterized protein
MQLQGETLINAPRGSVWVALNDPEVLARCIDGVERLDRVGDNRFEGVLNAKVGPVKAKFTGTVELTELDPPHRYVLVGEGKGGVAGFAKGSAEVVLAEAEGGATLLRYDARSQVGGKLAQLGTRLVEGAAKGYAESFFAAFKREVEGPVTPEEAIAPPDAPLETAKAKPDAAPDVQGLPGWLWIAVLVALVVVVLAVLL